MSLVDDLTLIAEGISSTMIQVLSLRNTVVRDTEFDVIDVNGQDEDVRSRFLIFRDLMARKIPKFDYD